MKKVLCIGGGTGQSALLKGLKQVDDIELSTVVATADDGGSTGQLRHFFNLPAMGDVRNVMVALADSEDLMTKIMNYRFDSHSGQLSGHNLGNIIISALAIDGNDFYRAVVELCKILKVKGRIYPSTIQSVTLKAHMMDGSIVSGETQIRESQKQVRDVFYDEQVNTYPQLLKAIEQADYIIVGIGSLFTSILPNIIIDDIRKALCNCKGKIIYYCNIMTEKGETDNYSVEQHVEAINSHIGEEIVDAVVISSDVFPEAVIESYALEEAEIVKLEREYHKYKVYRHSLLNFDKNLVRHDPIKVRDSFLEIMKDI
ncbi:MAG: YvcK family protein [Bacillota bacterium]|jgi:uncharacterized cofD-like protein|nr:YvcK family protein [Bacillota bacterium]NLL27081.1 YvcK family protein [Erysipelotrichia bacterium]